jgi:hypothetical protein
VQHGNHGESASASNALGVSDLHWVWAIDATSGPRSFLGAGEARAYQPS